MSTLKSGVEVSITVTEAIKKFLYKEDLIVIIRVLIEGGIS